MVSHIPNTPYPYILAHSDGDLLMMSHCRCPTYPPFIRDNLKVTHANTNPISSLNAKGPSGGNQLSNPKY